MCEIYTQHQSWPLIGRANMKCIDILFSHVLWQPLPRNHSTLTSHNIRAYRHFRSSVKYRSSTKNVVRNCCELYFHLRQTLSLINKLEIPSVILARTELDIGQHSWRNKFSLNYCTFNWRIKSLWNFIHLLQEKLHGEHFYFGLKRHHGHEQADDCLT